MTYHTMLNAMNAVDGGVIFEAIHAQYVTGADTIWIGKTFIYGANDARNKRKHKTMSNLITAAAALPLILLVWLAGNRDGLLGVVGAALRFLGWLCLAPVAIALEVWRWWRDYEPGSYWP